MLHENQGAPTLPKKRILFVDDEPRVLDGLRRTLRAEQSNWEMTFVGGVEQAMDILAQVEYDAVISDMNMPVRDGLDLLQSIREDAQFSDIPVVILTGNGEPDMKRRALDLGATDLLSKPVVREDLIARIRSVLRLKEYTDQIKQHGEQLEQRVRQRTAELEYSRAELIWRLGKAGEFRDSDTGFHVVRVGFFAQQLGKTLGLEESVVKEIFLSAPLHDIGKIGIPDSILLKPGKLDAEEWEIMKRHAEIGGQILRAEPMAEDHSRLLSSMVSIGNLGKNPVAEIGSSIAECHHERWDGAGYPAGLVGEAIPLAARITSIADVYDALSSERPYKKAFDNDKVLEIMRNGSGSQFDPNVFAAFEDSLSAFSSIKEEFKDELPSSLQADACDSLTDLLDGDE